MDKLLEPLKELTGQDILVEQVLKSENAVGEIEAFFASTDSLPHWSNPCHTSERVSKVSDTIQ